MKTCPVCGKEFTDPKHPDRKYCSSTCSGNARKLRVVLQCPACGKEYETGLNKRAKYCSRQCADKHKPHPSRPDSRKMFTCVVCGKQFETWAYRNPSACSPECRGRMAKGIPRPNRYREGSYITRNCDHCGKPYTLHKIFFEQRNSRFCSIECRAARQSVERRGAGNVNYRGGTITYRGRNWGSQKRQALERDGFKCRICGKKIDRRKWDYGIHHIKPYREFNGDYERANELTNLITLCRSCHSKVEHGNAPCPRPLF